MQSTSAMIVVVLVFGCILVRMRWVLANQCINTIISRPFKQDSRVANPQFWFDRITAVSCPK